MSVNLVVIYLIMALLMSAYIFWDNNGGKLKDIICFLLFVSLWPLTLLYIIIDLIVYYFKLKRNNHVQSKTK